MFVGLRKLATNSSPETVWCKKSLPTRAVQTKLWGTGLSNTWHKRMNWKYDFCLFWCHPSWQSVNYVYKMELVFKFIKMSSAIIRAITSSFKENSFNLMIRFEDTQLKIWIQFDLFCLMHSWKLLKIMNTITSRCLERNINTSYPWPSHSYSLWYGFKVLVLEIKVHYVTKRYMFNPTIKIDYWNWNFALN